MKNEESKCNIKVKVSVYNYFTESHLADAVWSIDDCSADELSTLIDVQYVLQGGGGGHCCITFLEPRD
jgi:hypothetical protein